MSQNIYGTKDSVNSYFDWIINFNLPCTMRKQTRADGKTIEIQEVFLF